MKVLILWCVLVFLLAINGHAETIRAEGFSSQSSGPIAERRAEALTSALIEAASLVGLKLEATSLLFDETTTASVTEVRCTGFVDSYEIVEEQEMLDGRYHIRIQAEVIETDHTDQRRRSPEVAVQIQKFQGWESFSRELTSLWLIYGFRYQADAKLAAMIACEWAGLPSHNGIQYIELNSTVSLYDEGHRTHLLTQTVRGFGRTVEDAERVAMKKAVRQITSEVVAGWSDHLAGLRKPYTIILNIGGAEVGRFSSGTEILNVFAAGGDFLHVNLRRQNAGLIVLEFETLKSSQYVINRISSLGFRLIKKNFQELEFARDDQ